MYLQEKIPRHERGLESPGKNGRINNANLLVRNLLQHFNIKDQSDITLKVASQRFHLHKILLARSDVFRAMMLGQFWDDSRRQEIELQESEECLPYMESFFRYFYTAEINLTRENVLPIMILANKYNVKDLEEACERNAYKMVFSGTEIDQIVEWWHISAQLGLRLLHKKCRDYLLLNMDSVLQSSHFLDMSVEYLCELIKERDMVVKSEYCLYEALIRWLNKDSNKPNLDAYISKILPHIKFCMMSTDELLDIEQSFETQPELEKHMQKHLYNAFKFHAVPFDKRGTTKLASMDCPRLYTSARLPKIGATLRLHTYERESLENGIRHNISIPVSLSNADRDDCKDWLLVFHSLQNSIQLEICSALCPSEQFDTVEASVLIYKQINGIKFVKGVMQFRCRLQQLPDVPCGHVFNVHLPKTSLDPNSPYLIKDEAGEFCQFCLVLRHYHSDVFKQGSPGSSPQAPLSHSNIDRETPAVPRQSVNTTETRQVVENLSHSPPQ